MTCAQLTKIWIDLYCGSTSNKSNITKLMSWHCHPQIILISNDQKKSTDFVISSYSMKRSFGQVKYISKKRLTLKENVHKSISNVKQNEAILKSESDSLHSFPSLFRTLWNNQLFHLFGAGTTSVDGRGKNFARITAITRQMITKPP